MEHDIRKFRINGMTPFLTHADEADQRLDELHALLIVLGDAATERDGIFGEMNSTLQGNVFRGLAALLAYAQFHLEAHDAGRKAAAAQGEV